MNLQEYETKLQSIFTRYPSVQNVPFKDAYKPGLGHMLDFDGKLGHPSRGFRSIHVAGTNGKGSVANMLASALASKGLKVGLYTSPHIEDFRERMRIIDGESSEPAFLISKEEVWDFLESYESLFEELSLSFFEITTGMAFKWFSDREVDVAVIEVGLGGRLDSTNIITPELSVITSIGLDHCAMLGDTRAAIAGEKGGIIKEGVPVVIGSRDPETEPVFRAIASDKCSPVHFADDSPLPDISKMDLQGPYQAMNLRTTLRALEVLGVRIDERVTDALDRTAARMDFHGRWERLGSSPDILCDIGHNPPALRFNFAELDRMLRDSEYTSIIIIYGIMADKDLDSIIPLMPRDARYIFATPETARAMAAEEIFAQVKAFRTAEGLDCSRMETCGSVPEAVDRALRLAGDDPGALIYIGGSTFVVSEAVAYLGSHH